MSAKKSKKIKKNKKKQLNAVLMSFIHDIKNSLLISLTGLDELYTTLKNTASPQQKESFNQIQYQLRRINNDLVQLLSLYKIETQLFALHADQYNLYDFLDELIINNSPLNKQDNFSFQLDCDEDLDWFFDQDLMTMIINSSLSNSIRYTSSRIIVSAKIKQDFLEISIEDDGNGFPQQMFIRQKSLATAIDMKSGSTGLGLYFSEQIAQIHRNGERQGSIRIDNNSQIGGGRFTLFLP